MLDVDVIMNRSVTFEHDRRVGTAANIFNYTCVLTVSLRSPHIHGVSRMVMRGMNATVALNAATA